MTSFADDMRRHFARKLNKLTEDTIDTCRRVDASVDETVTIIVTPMLHNLCRVISTAGGDEDDLVELVQAFFRSMQSREGMGGHQRERHRQ